MVAVCLLLWLHRVVARWFNSERQVRRTARTTTRGRGRTQEGRVGLVDVDGCLYKKGWNHKLKCPVAPSIIISLALRRLFVYSQQAPPGFRFPQTLSVCISHRNVTHMFTLDINRTWLMQDGSMPTCIPSVQRPSSLGSPVSSSTHRLLGTVYLVPMLVSAGPQSRVLSCSRGREAQSTQTSRQDQIVCLLPESQRAAHQFGYATVSFGDDSRPIGKP